MIGPRNRTLLWVAIAFAALLIGGLLYVQYSQSNDSEIEKIALDSSDAQRNQIGQLRFLGGIAIPRMGENLGGLSSLRWDTESERLLSLTDDARWFWLTLEENGHVLTGLSRFHTGPLLGLDGAPLVNPVFSGKGDADSESLTRSKKGGWLVGFEHNHRIWHYPDIAGLPQATPFDPRAIFGQFPANSGLETLTGDEESLFLCVQREPADPKPNCARTAAGKSPELLKIDPPAQLLEYAGVATDADTLSDGTILLMIRSYTAGFGNTVGIVAINPAGEQREIAALAPPITLDNFEGLAVREEGERTFLYFVSDDNFSSDQRTLLVKFELVGE